MWLKCSVGIFKSRLRVIGTEKWNRVMTVSVGYPSIRTPGTAFLCKNQKICTETKTVKVSSYFIVSLMRKWWILNQIFLIFLIHSSIGEMIAPQRLQWMFYNFINFPLSRKRNPFWKCLLTSTTKRPSWFLTHKSMGIKLRLVSKMWLVPFRLWFVHGDFLLRAVR